jgi:hypothetical protein
MGLPNEPITGRTYIKRNGLPVLVGQVDNPMPHSFQSGAANSGRSRLFSRLFPKSDSLARQEKPPQKAAAGKIACPTTKAEGWTQENYAALG